MECSEPEAIDVSNARTADQAGVSVICWAIDERSVLVSINGRKSEWKSVVYVGSNPDVAMNNGYIKVNGKPVLVFS